MESKFLVLFFLFFVYNSVLGNSCGGLLEGEQGRFSVDNASNQEQLETPSSSCLWVIQLHYENNVRFTLDALDDGAHLNLYSEDQLTSCSARNYTKLNSTQVGSLFEFLGKTLIVVLPNSSASVAFSWHFVPNESSNSSVAVMKNSDYIISPNGLLEWEQIQTIERVTWLINANGNLHMRWDMDVATHCDAIENCACLMFSIFQLTSEGFLSEAVRSCGQSSDGKLERLSILTVVLIKVNTKVEANKVAISWQVDDVGVTKPPVTEPPVPTATGLFAATEAGLISINLQTLEATALTSEDTSAVAVNHKLKKVYWTEISFNSRIMRSNYDGSAKEVIVPPTGDWIFMLAIDEPSGNVYFSKIYSHEITACDALGQNCATVISNSSIVQFPYGIALDSENRVMYWGSSSTVPHSVFRANLDGTNSTIVSSGFNYLIGLTLDGTLNDVLYWAHNGENTIGSLGVIDGNKQTLLELEGDPGPWGIQVDAHKIYFSSFNNKNIQSVDKYSGTELTTIFNSTGGVLHLALFSAPVKQA